MKLISNRQAIACGAIILMIACAPIHAATFNIADGDVAALKAAIDAGGNNGEADTINLADGGTYSLTVTDNTTGGGNGLPVIAADGGRVLTINGNGAVIQRSSSVRFRILRISAGAVVTLNRVTLRYGGSSTGQGAGILNDNGTLELVECTLIQNTLSDSLPTAGGAIYQSGGKLTLRRCTLAYNNVHCSTASTGTIARAEGAGIYNFGGRVEVQLCTFSGNSVSAYTPNQPGQPPAEAKAGGAAIASTGPTARLLITNSTFNQNDTSNITTQGKTISSTTDGATVELGSSIVFGSTPVFTGSIVSRGYNLTNADSLGIGVTDGDQLNTNPQLKPLASNGGPTLTHAIHPSSPAADKGKRDAIPALAATTDQRGFPRPVDQPGIAPATGGDNSDIGAYEVGLPQTGTLLTVTSIEDHENGLCSADDCTLREAIATANALAGNNTIGFAPDVTGIIRLTGALPNLGSNITIDGPGAHLLEVRRDIDLSGPSTSIYRIFTVSSGTIPGPIVTLMGLKIANGQGTGSPANGGGIFNDHGTLRIERCRITENHATNGAGVWSLAGSMTIVDSTIDDNDATGFGGGLFNSALQGNATVTMANVTLENNAASRGAAIYNTGPSGAATVTLQNVTVFYNFYSQNIYNDGATSKVSPRNSIFFPTPGNSNFLNVNGATVNSFGYNISSDAAGGDSGTGPGGALTHATDRRNTDPKFAASLNYFGGETPTVPLRSDSPAINAGDHNSAPTRDQRGFLRAGTADIGAFEFGGTLPVTLANIATRLRVENGDNVLIGGFIVTGSGRKRVIVRAMGPSLPVPGALLADPKLEVYNSSGQRIAENDNWRSTQEAEIIATGVPPGNNLEAAATGPVDPGAYTVVVSGANGGTGIGLVEVFDLDRTVPTKLANIATRGLIRTGDNVMIGGFIVLGADSQKVIVRAIGPSLPFGNKLADPFLELHDGNGATIATNDNWTSDQQAEIEATQVPPANDLESALVRTLAPGNYTAVVKSANNAIGVAVVEVYALQQ